jgi:exopolysaccharide biosynthesis polyprenyl glycosylphosphotransferase
MFKPTHKISAVYFFIDAVIIFLCFFISLLLANSFNLSFHIEYIYIYGFWAVLIIIALQRKKLYSTDRTQTIPKEALLVLTSVFYVSLITGVVLFFLGIQSITRSMFGWSFVYLCVGLSLWRMLKRIMLRYLIVDGFHNFNTLIVGVSKKAHLLMEEIKARPYLGLRIVGVLDDEEKAAVALDLPVLGGQSDFEKVCKKYFIDEVFIADASSEKVISRINHIAQKMQIGVRIIPTGLTLKESVIDMDSLGSISFLTIKERETHPSNLLLKRMLDLSIAVPLFILVSPVMAAIALLIKIDSPGPVFYMQKRAGKRKMAFSLYKFRSMVAGAEELKSSLLASNEVRDGIIFKMRNDPRVTRVGRFLRRYSLDELPQLYNVIKGDLSLVGPRPLPIEESDRIEYYHMPRLNIKPGITGLVQVRGRSDLSFSQWAKLDLWYMHNWSLGLDLKILLWTIPAVLQGEGAY